jgi:hypothetical protein
MPEEASAARLREVSIATAEVRSAAEAACRKVLDRSQAAARRSAETAVSAEARWAAILSAAAL